MRISDWSSDVCSSDLPSRLKSWQSAQQPYRHTAPILRRTPQAFWQWGPPSPKAAIWSDRHISLMSTIGTQPGPNRRLRRRRSEEHTSELQSLMRISYAVFCLKKKKHSKYNYSTSKPDTHHVPIK